MGNTVAVFIETRDGVVHKSCWQTVSQAKILASQLGGEVVAIAAGPASADALAEAGVYGASKVKHCPADSLANYSGEGTSRVVVAGLEGLDPAAVLFSATAMGKDLAPRVAARLERSVTVDCTGMSADGGKITVVRPVLAGKANQTLVCENPPLVASLRPNAFPAVDGGGAAPVETFDADPGALRDQVAEVRKAEGAAVDVTEAEVVVSGGRGLGDNDNYEKLILPLAKVLGGARGASRAIVDAGWRPHAEQVGQTGKTVSPKLYIAVGISGAIQHKAGMDTSGCIVAINKDKDAAIFKFADYGIVGDANEIVPALTEQLQALLG